MTIETPVHDLRLYAVLRTDIRMSIGKAAAQAGHAYVNAINASRDTPEGEAYAKLDPGTKICLSGGTGAELMKLHDDLASVGVASFTVFDQDHVELPDFTGARILTALGVGPIRALHAPAVLRVLSLYGKPKPVHPAPPVLFQEARERKWA